MSPRVPYWIGQLSTTTSLWTLCWNSIHHRELGFLLMNAVSVLVGLAASWLALKTEERLKNERTAEIDPLSR